MAALFERIHTVWYQWHGGSSRRWEHNQKKISTMTRLDSTRLDSTRLATYSMYSRVHAVYVVPEENSLVPIATRLVPV
jgi:hypothetical protein